MSFQQPPGSNEPPPYGGGPYPPQPPPYGAQPSYGPPPAYGSPLQGPAGQPQGPWPYGYGPPQPPPRRGPGTPVIVAAVVGVVAVVAVVVLVATGVLFSSDDKGKDNKADPVASSSATDRPTAPAPPVPPSRPATTAPPKRVVDTPTTAGGLNRLTESEYPQVTAVREKAVPGSKVAAYGKSGAAAPTALVMLMSNPGGAAPTTVLEQMMLGMREGADKQSTTDLGIDREMDAGPMGGAMRCITIKSGAAMLPTCVWADRDTVGVVYAVNETSLDRAAALALRMRPDLEQ